MNYDKISHIPIHLRVRILHQDDDIIVINKPCNLRSVPGHKEPPPPTALVSGRKRLRSSNDDGAPRGTNGGESTSNIPPPPTRRTAQEAWEEAIRTFTTTTDDTPTSSTKTQTNKKNKNQNDKVEGSVLQREEEDDDDENNRNKKKEKNDNTSDDDKKKLRNGNQQEKVTVQTLLGRLASSSSHGAVSSIPRKWKTFHRYVIRNHRRLGLLLDDGNKEELRVLANGMFLRIQERQRPLLNLPQPTSHEDSALGQLVLLLGYDGNDDDTNEEKKTIKDSAIAWSQKLYVVHRLDCATSGVMVFGRNSETASFLSQCWREKGDDENNNNTTNVSKVYVAKVHNWPPYQNSNPPQRTGQIDVPLSPSDERLKWKVDETGNGKPSRTLWKVINNGDNNDTYITSHNSKRQQEHQQQEQNGVEEGGENDKLSPNNNMESDNNDPRDNNDREKNSSHHDKRDNDSHAIVSPPPIVLELQPITGRTHQLRIHCATIGNGIIGDTLYGPETKKKKAQEEDHPDNEERTRTTTTRKHKNNNDNNYDNHHYNHSNRLFLHAHKLSFPHPKSQTMCEFVAPIPW